MPKSTHIPVPFWLNDQQKDHVRKAAIASGLSLSEYLRRKVLGDFQDGNNAA
ncbi:plasmid mobilization protein [Picosynechococcus sp. PCC 73109]|uniref:plasmid mobilization protein n=1 Tax=Picosynechococcus sp. PCC 73109 TaxID=374982 RepID=UPI0018DC4965